MYYIFVYDVNTRLQRVICTYMLHFTQVFIKRTHHTLCMFVNTIYIYIHEQDLNERDVLHAYRTLVCICFLFCVCFDRNNIVHTHRKGTMCDLFDVL